MVFLGKGGRHDQIKGIICQSLILDSGIGSFIVHDGKIQFSGEHQFVQLCGIIFFKMNGDLRIDLTIIRENPGQKVGT